MVAVLDAESADAARTGEEDCGCGVGCVPTEKETE